MIHEINEFFHMKKWFNLSGINLYRDFGNARRDVLLIRIKFAGLAIKYWRAFPDDAAMAAVGAEMDECIAKLDIVEKRCGWIVFKDPHLE